MRQALLGIITSATSGVLLSLGLTLQKMAQINTEINPGLGKTKNHPYYKAGIVFITMGIFIGFLTYGFLPLSTDAPLTAQPLIYSVLFDFFLLDTDITWKQLGSISIVLTGIVISVLGSSLHDRTYSLHEILYNYILLPHCIIFTVLIIMLTFLFRNLLTYNYESNGRSYFELLIDRIKSKLSLISLLGCIGLYEENNGSEYENIRTEIFDQSIPTKNSSTKISFVKHETMGDSTAGDGMLSSVGGVFNTQQNISRQSIGEYENVLGLIYTALYAGILGGWTALVSKVLIEVIESALMHNTGDLKNVLLYLILIFVPWLAMKKFRYINKGVSFYHYRLFTPIYQAFTILFTGLAGKIYLKEFALIDTVESTYWFGMLVLFVGIISFIHQYDPSKHMIYQKYEEISPLTNNNIDDEFDIPLDEDDFDLEV